MADKIVAHSPESEASSKVLQHPAFGRPPVANIRSPGRKKGTISLSGARHARWLADQTIPAAVPIAMLPVEQGRFNYPKAMLKQAYFCLGGDGVWRSPSMSVEMLSDEHFVSPMGKLLDQLEAEGHNVSGARAEWLAFREIAKGISSEVKVLQSQLNRLVLKRPVTASRLIDDAEC